MVDNDLSCFKSSYDSPVTVFADIPALLLCLAAQDRNQQFSASLQRVNPFFFKKYGNVLFFQLPDIGQGVYGISGKPADGFCNDHVNLSCHAVIDHRLEIRSLSGTGCTLSIICINPRQFPIGITFNLFCVILHLGFITGFLLFHQGTDTAVGCHPKGSHLRPDAPVISWLCRYDRYVLFYTCLHRCFPPLHSL